MATPRDLPGPEPLPSSPDRHTAGAAPTPSGGTPSAPGRGCLTASQEPGEAPPPPPLGGFGRYELLGELGRGGMGVVYKARDPKLHRLVALKTIRSGALAGPEELERFLREARAVAQLNHPHIIKIHDFGEVGGQPYFTMELAAGSLLACRETFAGQPGAAAALLQKVARAVQHAHARGILHRDLKPGNVLLDEHGEPLVSDFGLAKILDADSELTHSGLTPGTPAYMAPEQLRGGKACPQSDVWALGVVLYELVTGSRPFTGQGSELAVRVETAEPPKPRALRPDLDVDLEQIVLKCLRKAPESRYPSAGALADDLARWLREPHTDRPRPWPTRLWGWTRRHYLLSTAAALAGVAAGAAPLALGLLSSEPARPEDPLEGLRARLAAGELVTLIGPTGPPRWHRWRLAPGGFLGQADGGPFTVHSGAVSLLELLPDPGHEAYRLRAEVRHEIDSSGCVGLYFGDSRHDIALGELHGFCAATFADRGRLALDPAGRPRGRGELEFFLSCQAGAGQRLNGAANLNVAWDFLPAQASGRGPWRRLAVEVTPRAIQVHWEREDRPRARLPRATLEVAADVLTRGLPALRGVRLRFAARGPLGLYVRSSIASFRNVTVEPLLGQGR